MEIAKWKWLPLILSFQRPNGCFGILPGEEINPKNFDSHGYGKAKRSFVIRKRVEQRMSADGCLSHRISVALSALVAYVRRLMEHLALERNWCVAACIQRWRPFSFFNHNCINFNAFVREWDHRFPSFYFWCSWNRYLNRRLIVKWFLKKELFILLSLLL